MKGKSEARLRVDRMLQMVDPRPGSRVLLAGDIEGMLARRLAMLAGVEVVWLEPGGEAEAEPSALPAQGYTRLWGDLHHLPFPDGDFDVIASQFALEHLEDGRRALSEWSRVLKDGGVLALAAGNRRVKGTRERPGPRPMRDFCAAELRGLVEGAGLAVLRVSTLVPDLKLPALYRGDYSLFLCLEKIPCLRSRGRILFLRAKKRRVTR